MTDFLDDTFGKDASAVLARLLLVLLILIVTWLARLVLTALLPALIQRITKRTETRLDDQIFEAVRPPLRFLITLAGLYAVLLALELPRDVMNPANRVVQSLVALAIFWTVYRLVDPVVHLFFRLSRRAQPTAPISALLEDRLSVALRQVGKGLVFILGFTAMIDSWGYDVAGLIAGLGIAGAAVALAVKDTVANLFGYFVILADEPFRQGEYVVFDGISGTVEHLGFRSTRIRVLDQSLVTVPNNTILNANVINWSRLAKRRLNITLGIEYGSSPEQILSVVQAIRKMLETHELVQPDSVVVQFVNFNESSLDIMIICFMTTPGWNEFQAAKQDINLKMMDILAERGVGVAFPTRTVVMEQAAAKEAARIVPPPEPEPEAGAVLDSPVPSDAANEAQ